MELYGESELGDLSLEEAIRHKYCPPVDYSAVAGDALPSAYNRHITQTALIYKPGTYNYSTLLQCSCIHEYYHSSIICTVHCSTTMS